MTSTTLTSEQRAVVIAKVERLWRKARSTTFAAEAKAYEEKALYLMARARITDAMLDLESTSDSIVDVKVGATLAGGYRIPAEALFDTVCTAFGCRGYLYVSGRTSQPAAVGFASDVDRVKFLWPFLHADALAAAGQLRGRTAAHTMALRRSAMFGYAEAIAQRFDEINRIASSDADHGSDQSDSDGPLQRSDRASSGIGTELVVRARKERVDDHFAGLGVRGRTRRVSGGHGGHQHGHSAGMSADLTGGSRRVRGGGGELTS
ncbi:MAG: DUF2786 domain-containing protein [Acidimicrobiales bacterium]|nr:DUF2786 domain-containing protein [Acidimicrobiales bacterium]